MEEEAVYSLSSIIPWVMFSYGVMMSATAIMGLYLIFSKRTIFPTNFSPSMKIRRSSGLLILMIFFTYLLAMPFMDEFRTTNYSRAYITRAAVDFILVNPTTFAWLFSLLQDGRKYEKFIYSPIIIPILLTVCFAFTGDMRIITANKIFWWIFTPFFFLFFIQKLYSYQKNLDNHYLDDTHHSLKWLAKVATLGFILFVMYILGTRPDARFSFMFFVYYALELMMCIYITWIADHQCLIPEEDMKEDVLYRNTAEEGDGKDESSLEWIGEKLKKICEDGKLFLDPDIDSLSLAHKMGTNRTYVSRYLNSHGDNFNHYINNLRIDYAIRLIGKADGKPNLGEIAQTCGYKQMNSFRSAFKARTGVLPSEYVSGLSSRDLL